jgi:hypothetical protein
MRGWDSRAEGELGIRGIGDLEGHLLRDLLLLLSDTLLSFLLLLSINRWRLMRGEEIRVTLWFSPFLFN